MEYEHNAGLAWKLKATRFFDKFTNIYLQVEIQCAVECLEIYRDQRNSGKSTFACEGIPKIYTESFYVKTVSIKAAASPMKRPCYDCHLFWLSARAKHKAGH